ncbi:unnamed protein product, partial [Heterosigma akashiwo]
VGSSGEERCPLPPRCLWPAEQRRARRIHLHGQKQVAVPRADLPQDPLHVASPVGHGRGPVRQVEALARPRPRGAIVPQGHQRAGPHLLRTGQVPPPQRPPARGQRKLGDRA